jgi:hypothetical protein
MDERDMEEEGKDRKRKGWENIVVVYYLDLSI